MSVKKILMIVVVLALIAAPIAAMADTSDGQIEINEDKTNGDGFKTNSNGTVHIHLKSTETNDVGIDIRIEDSEGNLLAEKNNVNIPAGSEDFVVDVSVGLSGLGDHEIKIVCEPKGLFPATTGGEIFNYYELTVNVTESIWSKWTTYLAVAIVVILIVIAIFLRMRSASDKKPDTTFTDLENKRKSSAKDEPAPAASTERKRYKTEKTPAKEASKANAKKAESFTELEQRKSEAPKEKPKSEPVKESPKAEPKKDKGEKKLRYTSDRRK
ncbi:MAG: hypothetical protein LBS92_04955 [Candidatus Methanoplasma sp.]|jgi:hypothetical protein|nr:hypothetical protein [Candidatus Methanoplasma sp.]